MYLREGSFLQDFIIERIGRFGTWTEAFSILLVPVVVGSIASIMNSGFWTV
jgi:hypothetical protein